MERTLHRILLCLLISCISYGVEGTPYKAIRMVDDPEDDTDLAPLKKAEGETDPYDVRPLYYAGEVGPILSRYKEQIFKNPQDKVSSMWPLGIVSYNIDTTAFPLDHSVSDRVRDTMKYIESVSCVRFKPVEVVQDMPITWLNITNPTRQRECSHELKYNEENNAMIIVLGLDCLSRANLLHTLLHGIGFPDEVTHPQRDRYISIQWNNILHRYRPLFLGTPDDGKVMVEYDPMSIMHFHDRAFSRNGKPTVIATLPGMQIQPGNQLSQLDIKKLYVSFEHECNRRKADDLLQTCNLVFQKERSPIGTIDDTNNDQAGNVIKLDKGDDNDNGNGDGSAQPEVKSDENYPGLTQLDLKDSADTEDNGEDVDDDTKNRQEKLSVTDEQSD